VNANLSPANRLNGVAFAFGAGRPWKKTHSRLAGIVIALCLASCGGSAAAPTPSPSPRPVDNGLLTVDGHDRTYRVFVPPSLGPKQTAPLIIALHGFDQYGVAMATFTRLHEDTKASRFIVAYPDGIGKSWNGGGVCCGDALAQGVDDVGFISKLIDWLSKIYPIDRARVFITGFSNGGIMAYRLACELSDRIVAIASVSGRLDVNDCHPNRPVSVLEMHGTRDAVISYEGDQTKMSTASGIQRWVALNGCTTASTVTTNGITKTSTWNGCREGTTVRLDTVLGGQHTWFGSDLSPVPREPDASALIRSFFSDVVPR
jgi:polyhydroxybutyrate depolymerase